MAGKINMVATYLDGRVHPTSPKESYGHSNVAGRGYYTMAEMSDERTEDFMRAQKSSNNMVRVEGDMVGSWNLEF